MTGLGHGLGLEMLASFIITDHQSYVPELQTMLYRLQQLFHFNPLAVLLVCMKQSPLSLR